jgi:hypothetical protein
MWTSVSPCSAAEGAPGMARLSRAFRTCDPLAPGQAEKLAMFLAGAYTPSHVRST